MSEARNSSVAQKKHITHLVMATLISVGFNVVLVLLCFYMAREIVFRVPPNINDGGSFNVNDVPPTYIWDFSRKMWKLMNLWEENGEKDYDNNILKYQHYFTPSCRKLLKDNYYDLHKKGEIQYRKRFLKDLPDGMYKSSRVKEISDDVWETSIDLNLIEVLNDTTVKDITVRYSLRIVYFNIDEELNPWGLGIDCFTRDPILVSNNLEKQ